MRTRNGRGMLTCGAWDGVASICNCAGDCDVDKVREAAVLSVVGMLGMANSWYDRGGNGMELFDVASSISSSLQYHCGRHYIIFLCIIFMMKGGRGWSERERHCIGGPKAEWSNIMYVVGAVGRLTQAFVGESNSVSVLHAFSSY